MGWWGDNVPEETLSRDEATRVVRRLLRMLRPQRALIVVAVFVLMLQAATLLAGPLLVKHGIDAGLPHGDFPGDARTLNLTVLAYLAIAVVGFFLGRIAIVLVARIGERFLKELRNRLFGHMMSLSLDYFESEKTGKIVARMTSDIDAMQELVSQGLVLFVQNAFVFVGAVVVILVVSWQLALGILVIVPPVYFGSRWFRRVSNQAYLEVRDTISTNMSTLQESLEGVRVVQAFGREDAFAERFNVTNEDQYHANMHTVRISAKYFPIIEYAGVIGTAVIIGYGGWLTTKGIVTVGTVAAFVLWLNSLFEPINQLSQLYNTVQSSAAALGKIFGVLDTRPTVRQRQASVDLPQSGAVDVEHVTFAYGANEPVLHDVSLNIADGERLALVGPTGAGKSTLAKLIARFYDPVEGSVRVGDVDLRDAEFVSLRRRIIVVPQEGFLFAGTLRDNVRVGRPEATDAEVEDALRGPRAARTVLRVPGGSRDRGTRARFPVVGGRASARVAGAGGSRRSVGADPRRGDVEPRSRHRARGGARDGNADARTDGRRRGTPPLDRGPRRPHRCGV